MAPRQKKSGESSLPPDIELLVSDGHVRAARLRWIGPRATMVGAVALAAGLAIAVVAAPGRAPATVRQASPLAERTWAASRTVKQTLDAVFAMPVTLDPGQLPPATQLPQLHQVLLDSLTRTGTLPADFPASKTLSPEAWKSGEWPQNGLAVVSGDRAFLVGALVGDRGRGARVAALYRRGEDGEWRGWWLTYSQFPSAGYALGGARLSADQAPATLAALLHISI